MKNAFTKAAPLKKFHQEDVQRQLDSRQEDRLNCRTQAFAIHLKKSKRKVTSLIIL